VATVAVPLTSVEQWQNPNCVKVVCDNTGAALYFSRSPIPYLREGRPNFNAKPACFLQHLGLYAYRRDFLLRLAELPPSELEQLERLEQLRVLAFGHRITVGVAEQASIGVDTYEDYEKFVEIYRRSNSRSAA
jgi:3-deoxy-manno-octulosonate cytidylyltransferase (CMP-KDO synthetase)